MNVLCATGNLGKDAETRHTQTGKAVTSFSVAITAGYGDNAITTWVNCSLWGDNQGNPRKVAEFLKKGQKVAVSGPIALREYQSQHGSGKSLDMRVSEITLVGEKPKAEPRGPLGDNDYQPSQAAQQAIDEGAAAGDLDDDIPF